MIRYSIEQGNKWDDGCKKLVARTISGQFSLVQTFGVPEEDWQWEEAHINQQTKEDEMLENAAEYEEVETATEPTNSESETYEADDDGVVRELPEIPLATNVEYV